MFHNNLVFVSELFFNTANIEIKWLLASDNYKKRDKLDALSLSQFDCVVYHPVVILLLYMR